MCCSSEYTLVVRFGDHIRAITNILTRVGHMGVIFDPQRGIFHSVSINMEEIPLTTFLDMAAAWVQNADKCGS